MSEATSPPDPAVPASAASAPAAEGAPAPATASVASAPPELAPAVEILGEAEARALLAAPAEAPEQPVPPVADLPPAELRAVVESLLFVATKPLSAERLAQCLPGATAGYLERFLDGLAARYDHERRGWELRRIAGGWQLLTRREHHPWVRALERKELPTKLSKSALETLAIVAYKQPITRGQIEDIRGVQCGPVLRQLMDLRLVQVTGRAEHVLGRPLLYGTTEAFLMRFGLGSLQDLPSKHEFGA